MPASLVARIDLDKLYPPFRERALAVLGKLHDTGIDYVATYGYRSFQEQAKLYVQGRTQPGKIVTRAQPGLSAHNYGIAMDLVRDASPADGLQPDWALEAYRPLFEAAADQGLETGLEWKFRDCGHMQLFLDFHGVSLDTLKLAYGGGGMPKVWSILDGYDWPSDVGSPSAVS